MRSTVLAATLLTVHTCAFAAEGPEQPAAAPRVYTTAVTIAGAEAARFELRSPRLPVAELEKVAASPASLQALNEQHLAGIGMLTLDRMCRAGGAYLDAGRYRVGIVVAADRSFALVLTGDTGSLRVPLNIEPMAHPVPIVCVALLPDQDLEQFQLEVRFGAARGSVPVDFNPTRLIVAMNNTAHDLLSRTDAQARVDARAAALALRLAGKANELTSGQNALILDTYALALFHSGHLGKALEAQTQAIAMLTSEQEPHRAGMVARLRAFEIARGAAGPAQGK